MISASEAATAGLAISPGRLLFGVIPLYSLLIAAGILLAMLVATKEEKRLGLPQDTIVDAAIWLVPAGIIGARLYYVVFSWDMFAADPLRIFRIWEGGLAIYGAVLGGVAALAVFCRVRKLHLLSITDAIIPGLLLAQAIGRWGNYFNQEAYGVALTCPSLQFFPMGVLIPTGDGYRWHAAAFFYEFCWNMVGFMLLMSLRKKFRRRGDMTMGYMLIYGSGRMVIEGLRTDSLMALGDKLRISQLLSLLMAVAVLVILFNRLVDRWKPRSWVAASIGMAASLLLGILIYPSTMNFVGFRMATLLLPALVTEVCTGCLVQKHAKHCRPAACVLMLLLTVGFQLLLHFLYSSDAVAHGLMLSGLLAGWLVVSGGFFFCMAAASDMEEEACP